MSWPVVRLGDVVGFRGGGTPRKDNPEFWSDAIPWATVKDFKSLTLTSTVDSISQKGLDESSSNLITAGHVIIPTRMALGKVAINNIELAINQDLRALIPLVPLDTKFLLHAMLSLADIIEAMGSGATVKGITQAKLSEIPIPLPPLAEQKRIAGILDATDALRARRRESLAQLDTLLQSTFLEMFGDPVADAMRCKDIEVEKPAGWLHCTLGEQLTLQRGKDITKKIARPGDVPVISSGGVSFFHDEPLVSGPGVLLGRKGSVGKVHFSDADYWPHDTTLYIKDFKGNNPRYIYYFFLQFPISHYEASAANPSLNRNNLHPVEILWPPLDLQQRFAAIVESVEQQKVAQRAHLMELDTLFAALQQRAFGGEL